MGNVPTDRQTRSVVLTFGAHWSILLILQRQEGRGNGNGNKNIP